MNARKALITASAVLAASLTSCGTLNRAGKDASMFVMSPALIVYGGATDGYTTAKSVRGGMDAGAGVEVLAFPFTFFYHAIEHTAYAVFHFVDFFLCPFYGAAELGPNGPEIRPLDFYQGTPFDTWADKRRKPSTDAESGTEAK